MAARRPRRPRLKPWQKVVIPFQSKQFDKWLDIAMRSAMLDGVREEMMLVIDNILSGRAPSGGVQKQNKPDTIRKKKHDIPLIKKQQSFITPRFYKQVEVKDGWALQLPAKTRLLIRMGYKFQPPVLRSIEEDAKAIVAALSGNLLGGGFGGAMFPQRLQEQGFTSMGGGGGGGSLLPQGGTDEAEIREAA